MLTVTAWCTTLIPALSLLYMCYIEEVVSPVKDKPDGSVPGPDSDCPSDSDSDSISIPMPALTKSDDHQMSHRFSLHVIVNQGQCQSHAVRPSGTPPPFLKSPPFAIPPRHKGMLKARILWYRSRSKGAPLLETVIGRWPTGPEFLHIPYQGTGDKALDHTPAKLSQLEAGIFLFFV